MDLDLLTYAYHYDKEKNRSLNHNYFEVMAEVSYRNPRMCTGAAPHYLITIILNDINGASGTNFSWFPNLFHFKIPLFFVRTWIFSHVLRDSTPRDVGQSVGRSVGWSVAPLLGSGPEGVYHVSLCKSVSSLRVCIKSPCKHVCHVCIMPPWVCLCIRSPSECPCFMYQVSFCVTEYQVLRVRVVSLFKCTGV